MALSPIDRRRLANFRANRRGWWSLWLFTVLLVVSLGAELVANDKPLLVRYEGGFYFPVVRHYAETTFGGVFPTEAVYRDPALIALASTRESAGPDGLGAGDTVGRSTAHENADV